MQQSIPRFVVRAVFVLALLFGFNSPAFSASFSDLNANGIADADESDVVASTSASLPAGEYFFHNLTITNNATIVAMGDQNSSSTFKGVKIVADNLTVSSGSSISANGQGYSQGPGYVPGVPSSSYGGVGAGSNASSTYGSAVKPVDFGSGLSGYRGGGAVSIVVTDTFVNDGIISANGGGYRSSGGSVYINANKLSGAGSFSASGAGYYWPYPGPGGGGRIAVHYASSTFAGSAVGAGTAAFFDVTNNDVYIKNSFRFQKNDEPLNYHNIYLTNGASVEIEKGATLTANNISLVGASYLAISDGATINTPNITATENSVITVGARVAMNVPSVTIGLGSKLTLQGEDPFTVDSLALKDGGALSIVVGKHLNLNVPNLTVSAGSSISAWTETVTGTPDNFLSSGEGASVYIKSSGKFINNGSVSANGPAGKIGGSIYVAANELEGSGTFSSAGGSMIWCGWNCGYIIPSGGRIAVYYATSSFAGVAVAPGACGSLDGWSKTCAGAGTVVMQQSVPQDAPCTINCFSNIMFLPGLMGSQLYEQSGQFDDKLWPSSRLSDAKQTKLALDENGKSINSVYTKDDTRSDGVSETGIVDHIALGGIDNIYKSFIDDLQKWKDTDKIIEDYAFIPYDWRLSLDDIITNGASSTSNVLSLPYADNLSYSTTTQQFSESYIVKQLEALQKSSRTKKVTIVAHSNGGLVTKALIQKLKDTHNPLYYQIDKVILVAVPEVGTPDAIKALLHGNGLGPWDTIMSPERLRTLSQNMPGVYNQLPSKEFFSTTLEKPLALFDSSSYYSNTVAEYGYGIANYAEFEKYLNNIENRPKPLPDDLNHANTLNTKLITDAETTHALLDAWRPATSTKVIEVAGWGEYTLGGIDYRTETSCLLWKYDYIKLTPPQCVQYGDKQVLYTHDTLNGDGTVVAQSAHYLSDKNVPDVERWWVDLGKYNNPINLNIPPRDHKDILEVDKLRSFIKSEIINNPVISQYVSQTQPQPTKDYTRIQLNSPLTLSLYDSVGNHTGLTSIGEVEENIPGSRYRTLGESKYILVPQDVATTLRLEGYQNGSFSLNIDTLNGDTITASTTFAAIPSSTSTIVTMDLPANTEIQSLGALKVDFNGDGTTDVQLAPKVGEDVLPDATAPVTSVSLSGTLGNNGYYTSDITVTFSAVDDAIPGEISSGVAKTEYSLDGGATWNSYAAPFVVSTEGTTTIEYRSIDGLGNQEQAKTEVVHLDKTAPTIFASDTSAEQLTSEGTLLTILATVEDSIDANPIITTSVPLTQTFAPGVTNILLTAQDIAGNIATSSIAVTVYSSPTADPDGDGVSNQDDVKPFDATVFANLTIPGEYSLWEKDSFNLPFSVAGKGNVNLSLSNTYYRVGTSPVKDSTGAIVPTTVVTANGVITVSFTQNTKELKTYTLTLTTTKGNTKERDSIKNKRDHESDNEKRNELEKELKFANASIVLSVTNTTANKTTSETSTVNIYDKQQTAQLQYKYKDTNHSTTLLLKSDDVLKLKKGQPLELTVKVTGIKKDVPFASNIAGNFTMLSVVQEEEHSNDSDRKQTKFSLFFPQSIATTQESITITTTVNGITQVDVVGVRFEE